MLTLFLVTLLGAPPAPLRCLERHYGAVIDQRDGRWWVRFEGGAELPYDDGRRKDLEQKLAEPDVEDAFSMRYRPGPVRPVTTPDEDPGRVRLYPMLEARYGRRGMTRVAIAGRKVTVHRNAARAFERVAERLAGATRADPSLRQFLSPLGGTLADRNIAGTDRKSAHAYGIAIDLNPRFGDYWRSRRPREPPVWRNRIPQAIVDAFEAEGFVWGGRWYHYDTMHFEYRPDLLDGSCYPEIPP